MQSLLDHFTLLSLTDGDVKTAIHNLATHSRQFGMTHAQSIQFAEKRILEQPDRLQLIITWQRPCRLCSAGDKSEHAPKF